MKKLLILLFLLPLPLALFCQDFTIDKGSGVLYFTGVPGTTPDITCCAEIAYDVTTRDIYTWHRDSSKWVSFNISSSGLGSPNGAPSASGPFLYVDQNTGNLYRWTGAEWELIVSRNNKTYRFSTAADTLTVPNATEGDIGIIGDSILFIRDSIQWQIFLGGSGGSGGLGVENQVQNSISRKYTMSSGQNLVMFSPDSLVLQIGDTLVNSLYTNGFMLGRKYRFNPNYRAGLFGYHFSNHDWLELGEYDFGNFSGFRLKNRQEAFLDVDTFNLDVEVLKFNRAAYIPSSGDRNILAIEENGTTVPIQESGLFGDVSYVSTGVDARESLLDPNVSEVIFTCDSIVLDTNLYVNRPVKITLPACATLTAPSGMIVKDYHDVSDGNERVGCGVIYVDSLAEGSVFEIHGNVYMYNTNESIPGSTGRARMSSIFSRKANGLQINHPGFAYGGWNGISVIDANNINIVNFSAREPNTGQSGGADNSNAAVYPENVTNLRIGQLTVLGRSDKAGGYEEVIDPNAGMTDVLIENIYAEDVELGLGMNNSHRVKINRYTCRNCINGIDFFNYQRNFSSGILWSSLNNAMPSQDEIILLDAQLVYDSSSIYGSVTPVVSYQTSNLDMNVKIHVDSSYTGNVVKFFDFEGMHDPINSDAILSKSNIDIDIQTHVAANTSPAISFDEFDFVTATISYTGPVNEDQILVDFDPDAGNESHLSVKDLYLINTSNNQSTALDTSGLTAVDVRGVQKISGFQVGNDSLILEIDWLTSIVDTSSGGDVNSISGINNALYDITAFGTGSKPNHSNTDSAWVFQASNTEYLRNDQIGLNVSDYQTDLTIIAVVRFDAVSANQATLFQFSDGTNNNLLQAQWNNNSSDSLQYTIKGTNSDNLRPEVLAVNTWYVLSIVYNASSGTADVYVNETLVSDDVEFNEQPNGFSQFSIGYKNSDGLRPADMSLKYFKIWKGVYDPLSEIQTINTNYSIY